MRKISLLTFLTVMIINLNAQITHERTLSGDYAHVVQIDEGVTKYCTFHSSTHEIKVYNLDGTLYRTLTNHPDTMRYTYYITEKLFNLDSKIEYMVYDWEDGVRIYDEDGNILFQEDSLDALEDLDENWFETNTIVNTESGTKMFLFDWNKNNLEIYNLPGKLPYSSNGATTHLKSYSINQSNLKSYPNPTKQMITIEYNIITDFSVGLIELYSSKGELVEEYNFYDKRGSIIVGDEISSTGLYIYNLSIDGKQINSDKFLVTE